jgi:hypothetical protein
LHSNITTLKNIINNSNNKREQKVKFREREQQCMVKISPERESGEMKKK